MKRLSNAGINQQLVAFVETSEVYRDLVNAIKIATTLSVILIPNDGDVVKKAMQGQPHGNTASKGIQATLVPVRLGGRMIGFLKIGCVDLYRCSPSCLDDVLSTIEGLEVGHEPIATLRDAYLALKRTESGRYEAMINLMATLAQHLEATLNHLMVDSVANSRHGLTPDNRDQAVRPILLAS